MKWATRDRRRRSPAGSPPSARRARPASWIWRTGPAESSSTCDGTSWASITGFSSISISTITSESKGRLFRTKRGELSLRVAELTLLAKSLRPLPAGEDPDDRGGRRHLRRPHRSRDALPPALRRPRGPPRGPRRVPAARQGDRLDAAIPRRARVSRGRDTHPPAALRRRGGPALRHPPQRARHAALSADRGRAVSQAPAGGRGRAGLRDRPRLPERGHGPDATIPSSPCWRRTRPTPITPT